MEQKKEDRSTRIPVNRNEVIAYNRDDVPEYWEDEEITCPGCGLDYIHTAQAKAKWYEEEKRPLYIVSVRCKCCSDDVTKAKNICSEYQALGITNLPINELGKWRESILLLQRNKSKYNHSMLKVLNKKS